MKIKSGVSLLGIKPEMLVALMIAVPIFDAHGQECVITSCVEGKHSKSNSKHYVGYGIDLRTRDINGAEAELCAADIRDAIGDEYYVEFEKDHIHISYNGSVK